MGAAEPRTPPPRSPRRVLATAPGRFLLTTGLAVPQTSPGTARSRRRTRHAKAPDAACVPKRPTMGHPTTDGPPPGVTWPSERIDPPGRLRSAPLRILSVTTRHVDPLSCHIVTVGRGGGLESVCSAVQYGLVASLQLVVREVDGGREQLDAVDNPFAKGPDELELSDASVHVPRLGTESFIRLVAELEAYGFRVEGFDLRDYRMQPLDDDFAEEIQESIKGLLREHDLVAVLRYLNNEADDAFIVAVDLSGPSKRRFRLTQRGAITGYNSSPDAFVSALQETWRRAGVS
jgi:hypothetical protein